MNGTYNFPNKTASVIWRTERLQLQIILPKIALYLKLLLFVNSSTFVI